jgi:hypothetical protein
MQAKIESGETACVLDQPATPRAGERPPSLNRRARPLRKNSRLPDVVQQHTASHSPLHGAQQRLGHLVRRPSRGSRYRTPDGSFAPTPQYPRSDASDIVSAPSINSKSFAGVAGIPTRASVSRDSGSLSDVPLRPRNGIPGAKAIGPLHVEFVNPSRPGNAPPAQPKLAKHQVDGRRPPREQSARS